MEGIFIIRMIGAALIAGAVGVLTGVFGVGGGFLMTPALMILLGIPGPVAVGTGLGNFVANSSLGIWKRRGSGTTDFAIAAFVGGGSIIGVMMGSSVLEYLGSLPPITIRGQEQSAVQFVLLWAFLLLLTGLALFMYSDYRKNAGQAPTQRVGLFAAVRLPPYMKFSSLEAPRMSLTALVLLGLASGFMTGLLGIGGGVILLPALIYLVGLRTQKAAGSSLALVWFSSAIAFANNLILKNVDWALLAVLLVGGMAGTWIGTHLGLKISGPKLRLNFVWVLLFAILLVACKIAAILIG